MQGGSGAILSSSAYAAAYGDHHGRMAGGTIVVVVHTFRGENVDPEDSEEYIRIISARRATKNEIRQYHERLP